MAHRKPGTDHGFASQLETVVCPRFLRIAALAVLAFCIGGCANLNSPSHQAEKPRNIIILFGDGAAATQWEFGRYTSQVLRNRSFAVTDVVFKQGSLGLMTTHSADSPVTDSAAAASAMATGYKARTGAISVTPDGRSVKTVMELAKEQGKRVGLVTTATVHDASPAAFASHANSRRQSQSIVDQYLVFEPDVLMGGGRDYFLPKGAPGGRRNDGKDMMAAFAAKGYQVITAPDVLPAADGPRLLALFADGDMDLEIDRDTKREPSLAEMATAALRILSSNSPNGFVLFLENEGIDTAAHQNDAAALMRDLWAFDDALQVALEFKRRSPDTLILVTGDHETGGLSWSYAQTQLTITSRDRFYPGETHLNMLNGIKRSIGKTVEVLSKNRTNETAEKLVAENFPGFRLDADLRVSIVSGGVLERNMFYMPHAAFGRMVSRQTGIYWGTSGHTPEPVPVGAYGPGASLFRGYMDNTDFAKTLMRLIAK